VTRKIIVTCTGCRETWETRPDVLGAACGSGYVRPATAGEAQRYCDSTPVCWCESDSYTIPCEVH
jgi:hypothetical protein